MGDEYFKSNYRPLIPGNTILEYNNFDSLEQIDSNTAAVIIEAVQAEAGIILPKPHFLEAVSDRCKEVGALMILDEIQTGMGRTGRLFAFQHHHFVPDILLLAKAFGGGLPLGAFIADQKIMQSISHHPILGHLTTFGGNAVCCAAAEASLDVLTSGNILEEVESKGAFFENELKKNPSINNIHRAGLLMSIDFKSFERNKKIIDRCIENGLITDWILFCNYRMRIAPPLNITQEELMHATEIIHKSIESL